MALSTDSPKGKRILDFLKDELNLPENIIGITLEMKTGHPIKVKDLEYLPEDDAPGKQKGKKTEGGD